MYASCFYLQRKLLKYLGYVKTPGTYTDDPSWGVITPAEGN